MTSGFLDLPKKAIPHAHVPPTQTSARPLDIRSLREPEWHNYRLSSVEIELLRTLWKDIVSLSADYFEAEKAQAQEEGSELNWQEPRHPVDALIARANHEGVKVRHKRLWTPDQILRVGWRTRTRILGHTKKLVGGTAAKATAIAVKAFLLQGFSSRLLESLLPDRPDTLFLVSWVLALVLSAGIVWVARMLSHLALEAGSRKKEAPATPLRTFSSLALWSLIITGLVCFGCVVGSILAFDLTGGTGSAAERTTPTGALALNALFLAVVCLFEPVLAAVWRWNYTNGDAERLAKIEAAVATTLNFRRTEESASRACTRAFFAQHLAAELTRRLVELAELTNSPEPHSPKVSWQIRRLRRQLLALAGPGVTIQRRSL